MDYRIRKLIENAVGLPLTEFPDEGISLRVSTARSDKPKNRLLAQRVAGKNGVLVTGIPRVVQALKPCVESMSSWELFSPFGPAEIKRALSPNDAASLDETYGFNYFLTERKKFRPVKPLHEVIPLRKKDIPRGDEDLRMEERRSAETDDFIWAFACYHKDLNVPVKVLPKYGPLCASVAAIIWHNDDVAGFGVATEEALRGQGYALDIISTATQWILDQGAVAWYGAFSDNVPSLRIPKRLGYELVYSSFGA